MDWKLFGSTFVAIFLAELGDKTQLATFSLAASAPTSRLVVFAGAALALVATSALGVLLGDVVARFVPPHYLRKAAGVLFVALGVLYLVARGEEPGS
jgi:putative Ca2+/H+ antiporter (TMEM165/GDT1 family)